MFKNYKALFLALASFSLLQAKDRINVENRTRETVYVKYSPTETFELPAKQSVIFETPFRISFWRSADISNNANRIWIQLVAPSKSYSVPLTGPIEGYAANNEDLKNLYWKIGRPYDFNNPTELNVMLSDMYPLIGKIYTGTQEDPFELRIKQL